MDHLIYECPKLQREREVLVRKVVKQETWPREKSELVNKYIKYFAQFINSIDFDILIYELSNVSETKTFSEQLTTTNGMQHSPS